MRRDARFAGELAPTGKSRRSAIKRCFCRDSRRHSSQMYTALAPIDAAAVHLRPWQLLLHAVSTVGD